MPLIDVLEGIGNPEAYISNAIRNKDSEEEGRINRDLYGSGYLGRPQPTIQPGRGMLGSMLQGVGILDAPERRPLGPYEELLYTSGKQAREDRGYEGEKRAAELANFRSQNKTSGLMSALKLAEITGAPVEEILQANPEYGDDVQNYLTVRAGDKAREDEEFSMRQELQRAQLDNYERANQPPVVDQKKRNLDLVGSFLRLPPIVAQTENYLNMQALAARRPGDEGRKVSMQANAIAAMIRKSAERYGLNPDQVGTIFVDLDGMAPYHNLGPNGENPNAINNPTSYEQQWENEFNPKPFPNYTLGK